MGTCACLRVIPSVGFLGCKGGGVITKRTYPEFARSRRFLFDVLFLKSSLSQLLCVSMRARRGWKK